MKNFDLFTVKNSMPRACSHDGTVGLNGNMSIHDLPIRILDKMIANEEKTKEGFSVYNRGENLRNCLIDASRVKGYVQQ